MLDPATMWQELVFQARLRYLMFKRCVWLIECLLVLAVALVVHILPISDTTRYFCIAFALLRALTEALNHYHLATNFNARDRWHFLAPIALTL